VPRALGRVLALAALAFGFRWASLAQETAAAPGSLPQQPPPAGRALAPVLGMERDPARAGGRPAANPEAPGWAPLADLQPGRKLSSIQAASPTGLIRPAIPRTCERLGAGEDLEKPSSRPSVANGLKETAARAGPLWLPWRQPRLTGALRNEGEPAGFPVSNGGNRLPAGLKLNDIPLERPAAATLELIRLQRPKIAPGGAAEGPRWSWGSKGPLEQFWAADAQKHTRRSRVTGHHGPARRIQAQPPLPGANQSNQSQLNPAKPWAEALENEREGQRPERMRPRSRRSLFSLSASLQGECDVPDPSPGHQGGEPGLPPTRAATSSDGA